MLMTFTRIVRPDIRSLRPFMPPSANLAAYVQHVMDTHPNSSRARRHSLTVRDNTLSNPMRSHPRRPSLSMPYPPRPILPASHGPTARRHTISHTLGESVQLATIKQDNFVQPAIPTSVRNALNLAWAPATRSRYEVSIKEYLAFCDNEKVPQEARLPAGEMLLAMFAASLVGKIAGSTINAKISAVKAWHIQHNQPWRGNTLLQYVLKGAANATPEKSKQERRLPITIDMLKDLFHVLLVPRRRARWRAMTWVVSSPRFIDASCIL